MDGREYCGVRMGVYVARHIDEGIGDHCTVADGRGGNGGNERVGEEEKGREVMEVMEVQ